MAKTFVTKQVITLDNVRVAGSARKVRFNATTKRVRVTTKGLRPIIIRSQKDAAGYSATVKTDARKAPVVWTAKTPAKAFAKAVKGCWN